MIHFLTLALLALFFCIGLFTIARGGVRFVRVHYRSLVLTAMLFGVALYTFATMH